MFPVQKIEAALSFSLSRRKMFHCRFCSKQFSNMSNRRKHERKFHDDDEEEEEDQNIVESEQESTNEETEEQGEEEVEETDEEEEGGGSDEPWDFVVCEAAKDLRIFGLRKGTTAEQILQSEELVQLLIKQMGTKILQWKKTLDNLENECVVFGKLTKTKDRLVEQEDYDESEAMQKTFEERGSLLKEIVDEQEENIQEIFDKIDEEEESELSDAEPACVDNQCTV